MPPYPAAIPDDDEHLPERRRPNPALILQHVEEIDPQHLDEILARIIARHGSDAVAKSLERVEQVTSAGGGTRSSTGGTGSGAAAKNEALKRGSSNTTETTAELLLLEEENESDDCNEINVKLEDVSAGDIPVGIDQQQQAQQQAPYKQALSTSSKAPLNDIPPLCCGGPSSSPSQEGDHPPKRLSCESLYSLGSEGELSAQTDIDNSQNDFFMSVSSVHFATDSTVAVGGYGEATNMRRDSAAASGVGMSRCVSMQSFDTTGASLVSGSQHSGSKTSRRTSTSNTTASIAAAALRKTNERLRQAERVKFATMNAAFDPNFTLDHDGVIIMANKAAETLFGYDADEMVGHLSICSLLRSSAADASSTATTSSTFSTHPNTGIINNNNGNSDNEEEARLWAHLSQNTETKIELTGCNPLESKTFPVEVVLKKIVTRADRLDSFLETGDATEGARTKQITYALAVHDLTKRKEKELNERIQKGILKASFDPIFTLSDTGKILTVNHAAEKEFGFRADLLQGRSFASLIVSTDDEDDDDDIWHDLVEGLGQRVEVEARRANRSLFPIELGMVKIDGGEHIIAFVHSLVNRKKNEAEKRRKQHMINGIMNASFDPQISFDQSGRIILVNTAAVQAFGWSQDDVTNKNIDIDALFASTSSDGDCDNILQYALDCTSFEGHTRELKAVRRNGRSFPAECRLSEIKTGQAYGISRRCFVMFVHDLTRKKMMDAKLAQKTALTSGIVNSSFDALLAFSESGTIQMANAAATRLFGLPQYDLIGKDITSLLYENDEDRESAGHDWIVDLSGSQKEVCGRTKDGTSIPVMLGVSCIDWQEDMSASVRRNLAESSHPYVAFIRDLTNEKQHQETQIEKAKSDALLLNMLPEHLACRLKEETPSHIADRHDNVTILFADIVGFTEMSSLLDPVELVGIINDLFSRFDALVERHGLNKVKTIGDCYMATSMPGAKDHAEACRQVCLFALDIMDALAAFNKCNPKFHLKLRVGINTGPVVAGVVGRSRYLYDLWGDSVNLASRMESHGLSNRIQCTQSTIDLLYNNEDGIIHYPRGKIEVKGKGKIMTYFLHRDEIETDEPLPEFETKPRPHLFRDKSSRRVSCFKF